MSASEAQIAANRRNAQLSTGPRTEEGKARSRRNALKHGMTGEGVALSDEDAAEVEARFQEIQQDHLPSGLSSRLLLRRFAYMSVRLERCERLDTAIYSKRIRHAEEDYVDHRKTQVEALVARLAYDPMTTARRLQATPEGIDWLIGHWGELRSDLMNRARNVWTLNHWSRLERLLGQPEGNFRQSRANALTQALGGYFNNLDPSDGAGLDDAARVEWARDELARIIDTEVVRLQGIRASMDHWILEQDRLEAADRCLFDFQPAMNLVRKYEAATERSMYKALKEFHALEAVLKANQFGDIPERPTPKLASSVSDTKAETELAETIAHSAPRTPPPAAQIPETIHFPAKRSLDDAPGYLGFTGNPLC